MALLVDEQLAFGAFEALTAEAPDAIVAVGAKGFLWERGSNSVNLNCVENTNIVCLLD